MFQASNKEMSAKFNRANQLGQRNTPMASVPLRMLCLDSLFLACAASAMERASLEDERYPNEFAMVSQVSNRSRVNPARIR